mmetsp:Transcript_128842/g.400916  ORF Transcript_128842/g.400916 Transcript_128842/m.400916 type:complete len:200 (-) Transcript_128842:792-1391(-)
MAILSSPSGQSLRSGRPPGLMGVFPPGNTRSPAGTPLLPTRLRTAVLLSSLPSPLKFPQCPSWLGCALMVILVLIYLPSLGSLHRFTSIFTPFGSSTCTTWSALPTLLFCMTLPMLLYSMLTGGSTLFHLNPKLEKPFWMLVASQVMSSTPMTSLWLPMLGPLTPMYLVTDSPLVILVGRYLPWIQMVSLLTTQYSPGV